MRRPSVTLAKMAIAVFSFCYLHNSAAATVSASCGQLPNGSEAVCEILLSGRIVPGDAARLLEVIRHPPSGHKFFANLILDSRGGDVEEALRIAEVVKSALLGTKTYTNSEFALAFHLYELGSVHKKPNLMLLKKRCVSSCALIWIAGTEKGGAELGHLGLHRPFFAKEAYSNPSPTELSRHQNRITGIVRNYLTQEGMPSALIEKMLQYSSQDVYWITQSEALEFPSYAAWWDEMLIARCEKKSRQESIFRDEAYQRDPSNNKWKSIIESETQAVIRVDRCGRDLVIAAQQKLRQQSSR